MLRGPFIKDDASMKAISAFLNIFFLCAGILTLLPDSVCAKVTGPCSDCHTMHNSQDGSGVNINGPNPTLLNLSCIGCHTEATVLDPSVPYVMHLSEPTYGTNTPAGGSFWWVAGGSGDDAKGHNVLGLSGIDSDLSRAPGGGGCGSNSCHDTLAAPFPAGSYNDPGIYGPYTSNGCTGCHLWPAHHADDSNVVVGSESGDTDGYYRYLKGHFATGLGVCGIEDPDWEMTNSAADHNEYLGDDTDPTGSPTMTDYCCGCHGNFHDQQDSGGLWIRHPSDAVIPDRGEYSGYTIYDPNVPVARPNLTGWTEPSSAVTPDVDLVMCLSCHRPHGSPYDDMLRWEYSTMDAGAGTNSNGCFRCHSTKDDGV